MKPEAPKLFARQPDRFCSVCGASAGLHHRDGMDLCLTHYREREATRAARAAIGSVPQFDLFGGAL